MILAGGEGVNGRVHAPVSTAMAASSAAARRALVKLQHRHESLLRDLDRANSLHSPLAFLLPLQQFAFPGHVTAIAFGEHVLAHGRDRLPGDDLAADRRLARDLVELAGADCL